MRYQLILICLAHSYLFHHNYHQGLRCHLSLHLEHLLSPFVPCLVSDYFGQQFIPQGRRGRHRQLLPSWPLLFSHSHVVGSGCSCKPQALPFSLPRFRFRHLSSTIPGQHQLQLLALILPWPLLCLSCLSEFNLPWPGCRLIPVPWLHVAYLPELCWAVLRLHRFWPQPFSFIQVVPSSLLGHHSSSWQQPEPQLRDAISQEPVIADIPPHPS